MKKKGILYAVAFGAVLCALATSCLKDQEDYFSQSSSERMQGTMDELKQLLRSSEYGWEFEYYPGSNQDYGGIVYIMRFDSLTVDISCSLIADSTETSYYRVGNDSGPILTFDTYNRLFHYFSTPNSSEYEAKGGEFEFVVKEMTSDLITLFGKKTRNTMYLRRLSAPADDYAEKTIAVFDRLPAGFTGTVGATEVEATFALGTKSLECVQGTDTVVTAFAFNEQGIHFYRPVRLGDATVQSLAYDAETNVFTCTDEGHTDLTFEGTPYPDDMVRFSDYEGRYTLRYKGTSTAACTLVPNRLDGSYLLTGLSEKLVLKLTYDYATGHLNFGPQIVGEINGATVYFATLNSSVGSLWLSDAASFTLVWNGNKNRVAYNINATNPNLYNCDSGALVKVFYDEEGSLSAALVTESEWQVNNSYSLYNMTSLQKQR